MDPSPGSERIEPANTARRVAPEPGLRLPVELTSLIGRASELAEIAALLGDPAIRLVTLAGPGGVGKTRLAIRTAERLASNFPDGAAFVDLAPIQSPDLVSAAIARVLGANGAGQQSAESALINVLRERSQLLILDNFEHVSDAAAAVADLLRACPRLTVLVTSRSLLNVSGEHAYFVRPLSLERPSGRRTNGDQPHVDASDAVRLFVDRTRAVNPTTELTPANERSIEEIVRRLDGLPLAIELAAARGALLSPAALLARLDDRLPLLTGGARDQPARHQTMRSAITWSCDLLKTEERRVFRCLGAFIGGCTLEAAEAVCGQPADGLAEDDARPMKQNDARVPIIETIESLVRQSLVQRSIDARDGADESIVRISMLETIREFAAEELAASGDERPARRHAEHYLAEAARAEEAFWGDIPADGRDALNREDGNLRAALNWAIQRGEADLALRLAGARFDPHVGGNFHWTSGAGAQTHRRQVRRALETAGGSPSARVRALLVAAWLAGVVDEFEEGRAFAVEALNLARAHGDRLGHGGASFVLGVASYHQGNVTAARGHLREALGEFQALGARGRVAWTLQYLASTEIRDAIDEGGHAESLARGAALFEAALATFKEVGHAHGIGRASHGLAYVTYKQRDLARSLKLTAEVLALDWERRWPVYFYLEDIADIAGRMDAPMVAARLYGAAHTQRERAGHPLEPVFRDEYERDLAVSRRALGEVAFGAGWDAGRMLSTEQSVAEALAFAAEAARAASADPRLTGVDHAGLTSREIDVLRLIADGRSDREIAEALFISRRTASKHVESIFLKLRVHSRAAAATECIRRGLAPIDREATAQ